MIRRALAALLALAPSTCGAGAVPGYTEAETAAIVQHGPWPPGMHRDPSNRASGERETIDLGARLFFDPRLSGSGKLACVTCHVPGRAWTDGRKLGVGVEEVDRNTPSVMNARFNRWFGWDGASDSLWAQSIRPMLDAREMAANEAHVANLMRNDVELACRYRRAYGAPPPADDERVLVDVAKALAAFQETIVTARTPFDDFRDAIARGDAKAAAEYPPAAQRGAKIFVGKGRCNLCHFGPGFTHGEFHEIGIPIAKKSGGMDWGRYQGIKLLEASRYNLLGAYNDDAKRSSAVFTQHVALTPMTLEQFRVPTLRNVALTAPYMHNGHLATLRDVVRHYAMIDPSMLHVAHVYLGGDDWELAVPQDRLLQSIRLAEPEIGDLVAFLETLTEKGDAMRRPPVVDAAACREK